MSRNNDNSINNNSIENYLKTNDDIFTILTKYKNKITYYHNNKSWDKFKKISNEYELIFTTPNTGSNISGYNPVSRSYFKLWEILYDFQDYLRFDLKKSMKCLFLAEGPGGFAEALVNYRNNPNDKYYGISLKSNNDKNIPEWKLQKECMKRVKVVYGADDTGNLYNFQNIKWLEKEFNAQSMDFITADGGFDFSADFNNQEEQSFKLILCEILTAIHLQKYGGSFVLKIFDMFNANTIKLIDFLSWYYDKIYIVKPLTSRPANSEKYIVCTGFHRNDPPILPGLVNAVINYDNRKINEVLSTLPYNEQILKNIVTYNAYYTIRQVSYIEKTIQYIEQYHNKGDDIKKIIDYNINKSKKWCMKYNIPY